MRKRKQINKNQRSFFFEDFIETNQRHSNGSNISEDRILILFFSFIFLILSFSTKIFLVSLKETSVNKIKKAEKSFVLRRDIVDRNGDLISRNIVR